MQKMRNEKGITLVVLILTMILLVIIAAISIDYAFDGIAYSQERKLLTEVEEVQQAVMEKYTELSQLDVEKDANSYNDIASSIDPSTLEEYSSILKHTYTDDRSVEPDKKYYTLSAKQLEDLDVVVKNGIPDNEVETGGLKDSNGDYVLYIVNFYYGEVLNIYSYDDYKTEHSGQLLYTIGRSDDDTNDSSLIGSFKWNGNTTLDEISGLKISIDTEYNTRNRRSLITFNIRNNSDETKVLNDITLNSENNLSSVSMYSSNNNNYEISSDDDNNIYITLSDYGKKNLPKISPGRSLEIKVYVTFSSTPNGNINVIDFNRYLKGGF